MRIGAKPDGAVERLGLLLNEVPVPVGEALYGMPVSRSLQVAQRTGMLEALAEGPQTADQLAARLELQPTATGLVLDVLASMGHVRYRDERYELSPRGRRWLAPDSKRYVGDFLADTANYWEFWGRLEELVRHGESAELHDRPADDPMWRSYILGQYQLARLSSDDVAKAVDLVDGARSLLDVAGGHGEFSMALCRRHPELSATVVDLSGSARIGREIVAEAGMGERVSYVEGDMFEADFCGPHDGALCFNIIHHLTPERARELFGRVREALRPGAPLCVLDLYKRPSGERPDSSALLGLFFHLTSGADTYSAGEVSQWFRDTGFAEPKRITFRRIPGLALLRGEAKPPRA
jgi:hypothetical protein